MEATISANRRSVNTQDGRYCRIAGASGAWLSLAKKGRNPALTPQPCANPTQARNERHITNLRVTIARVTNARARRLPYQVERAITDSSTQSRMTLPAVLSVAFVVPMAKRPRSTCARTGLTAKKRQTGRVGSPSCFLFPHSPISPPLPAVSPSPPAITQPRMAMAQSPLALKPVRRVAYTTVRQPMR